MIDEIILDLMDRERVCWDMAGVFLKNRDAHGLMDMGAELQSLRLAIAEIRKVISEKSAPPAAA